jgi:transposase
LQVCSQRHSKRDTRKFSGKQICRECRQSSAQPSSSIVVTLSPSSGPPLFDDESKSHSNLTFMSRAAIVVMDKLGFNSSQIIYWTGHDQSTIDHWINHFNQHGDVQDMPRSGRPPVLSTESSEAIVSLAEEKHFITPKVIAHELQLSVSSRTVRRQLDKSGIFGRVARISYPFTDVHIEKRLAFASKYQGWDEAKWDTVLFSDESYISLGGTSPIWVQRPEDTEFLEPFMVHREPFPQKIGVWAAFSSQGVEAVRIFDGTMDSALLRDTFTQVMLPAARRRWPRGQWYLLQDNARYHTSTEMRQWIHNHGVDCIDFPPHSPDLNPIENLWAELKRRIDLRHPNTITELAEILNEEIHKLGDIYCTALSHSMINRCKAVITNRGFMTKY